MRFSDDEIRRYSRQIVLPEVGGVGQERWRAATVVAASEVEALYLAAAGVGTIIVPTEDIAAAVRALNPLAHTEVGNVERSEISVEQSAMFAWHSLKEALGL